MMPHLFMSDKRENNKQIDAMICKENIVLFNLIFEFKNVCLLNLHIMLIFHI